jgi:beta-carotene 3-hydroxylase
VLVAVLAFVLMEPATALIHRLIMHGPGWVLHQSHHATRVGRLEANDLYPVMFAAITILAMTIGWQGVAPHVLIPAGAGVTFYGVCYGFVHDVYIHERIRFPWRVAALEGLKDAHRVHHQRAGAPYGMLFPMRAATASFRHVGTRTR